MDDYNNIDTLEFSQQKTENISAFSKILKVFTAPSEAFSVIKDHTSILVVYIIYALVSSSTILIQYANGSMEEAIIDQLVLQGSEISDQIIQIAIVSGVVVGLVTIFIVPFISALFYHIICMIMGRTGYKKTLSVILHAMLIPILGTVIMNIVNLTTEISLTFTPLMFLDTKEMSNTLVALVSMIDIFSIWYMFVLFIGFRLVHELKKKEAIILVVVPFIFKVGFVLLGVALSETFTNIG